MTHKVLRRKALLAAAVAAALVFLATFATAGSESPSQPPLYDPPPVNPAVPASTLVEGEDYVPGELIVKFKGGTSEVEIAQVASSQGITVKRKLLLDDYSLVSVPVDKDLFEVAASLRQDLAVELVEVNGVARLHFTPNDPFYIFQWHFTDFVTVYSCGAAPVNRVSTRQGFPDISHTVNYFKMLTQMITSNIILWAL